jgi:hypothetical protein
MESGGAWNSLVGHHHRMWNHSRTRSRGIVREYYNTRLTDHARENVEEEFFLMKKHIMNSPSLRSNKCEHLYQRMILQPDSLPYPGVLELVQLTHVIPLGTAEAERGF